MKTKTRTLIEGFQQLLTDEMNQPQIQVISKELILKGLSCELDIISDPREALENVLNNLSKNKGHYSIQNCNPPELSKPVGVDEELEHVIVLDGLDQDTFINQLNSFKYTQENMPNPFKNCKHYNEVLFENDSWKSKVKTEFVTDEDKKNKQMLIDNENNQVSEFVKNGNEIISLFIKTQFGGRTYTGLEVNNIEVNERDIDANDIEDEQLEIECSKVYQITYQNKDYEIQILYNQTWENNTSTTSTDRGDLNETQAVLVHQSYYGLLFDSADFSDDLSEENKAILQQAFSQE